MLARQRLVALHLRGRIDMAVLPWWAFAKVSFDAVVDCKVYRPCGKVAEDGGPEAAVHAAHAVMLEDVLDGRWQTEG